MRHAIRVISSARGDEHAPMLFTIRSDIFFSPPITVQTLPKITTVRRSIGRRTDGVDRVSEMQVEQFQSTRSGFRDSKREQREGLRFGRETRIRATLSAAERWTKDGTHHRRVRLWVRRNLQWGHLLLRVIQMNQVHTISPTVRRSTR